MYGNMGGMGGMQGMMKKMQKIQGQMKKMQNDLKAKTVDVSVGGGAVKLVMDGEKQVKSITIDPEVLSPDDVEMLEDMVAAAINATVKQVDETAEAEMGKLTGGMNIPGL